MDMILYEGTSYLLMCFICKCNFYFYSPYLVFITNKHLWIFFRLFKRKKIENLVIIPENLMTIPKQRYPASLEIQEVSLNNFTNLLDLMYPTSGDCLVDINMLISLRFSLWLSKIGWFQFEVLKLIGAVTFRL